MTRTAMPLTAAGKNCPKCGGPMKPGKRQWQCHACNRAYARAWEAEHKENGRWGRLRRQYHLSRERYEAMVEEQDGVCKICGDPPKGRYPLLVVDHDWRCCPSKLKCCGRCIRGLLCDHCNRLLGIARDDPNTLRNAYAYIEASIERLSHIQKEPEAA